MKGRATAARRAARLGTARERADRRLARLPHVMATAFGLKSVGGKLTSTPCYSIFVDRKVPRSTLSSGAAVPDHVQRGWKRWPTDVVVAGGWIRHGGEVPMRTGAVALTDSYSGWGTLSCMAALEGRCFLISCAHVLTGSDRSILTPDRIYAWSSRANDWVVIGSTETGIYEKGSGFGPDFGFLDIGMVNLSVGGSCRAGLRTVPCAVFQPRDRFKPPVELLGREVRACGVASGPVQGQVSAVWIRDVRGSGLAADVLISGYDGAGISRPGDSGMLWMDSHDRAIAVHCLGENRPGQASRVSVAMFACRVQDRLGVRLQRGRFTPDMAIQR